MSLSASDWYDKSANDMDMVRRALEPSPDPNLEGAAFHVQQAAEKLLKGFLTQIGVAVPRTHDIGTLAAQIPPGNPLKVSAVELDAVTPWATLWRYPPDDPATNSAPALSDIQIWRQKVEAVGARMRSPPTPTALP